jgi:hypothetical protein
MYFRYKIYPLCYFQDDWISRYTDQLFCPFYTNLRHCALPWRKNTTFIYIITNMLAEPG